MVKIAFIFKHTLRIISFSIDIVNGKIKKTGRKWQKSLIKSIIVGTQEEYMKNNNYLMSKILTLIPIFVFAVTAICMVLATTLETPTNRGAIYTVFAFAGLMGILLSPLPCLIISIIGTVFAAKAAKEGSAKTPVFLILGIIEILIYIVGAVLAAMMFIAGQGV